MEGFILGRVYLSFKIFVLDLLGNFFLTSSFRFFSLIFILKIVAKGSWTPWYLIIFRLNIISCILSQQAKNFLAFVFIGRGFVFSFSPSLIFRILAEVLNLAD